MQKHRFISLIITAAIAVMLPVMIPSPALADGGPSGSASEAEMLGCQSDGYEQIAARSVRYGGDAYPGVGVVIVWSRPSPSNPDNVRVCAVTYHGSSLQGDLRYTAIEVGSEPQGNGVQDLYFWDRGDYRYHTDGRAITPGGDRCAVIHGVIKSADGSRTYQVWIDQNSLADSLICN